jgi:hypothetical protein
MMFCHQRGKHRECVNASLRRKSTSQVREISTITCSKTKSNTAMLCQVQEKSTAKQELTKHLEIRLESNDQMEGKTVWGCAQHCAHCCCTLATHGAHTTRADTNHNLAPGPTSQGGDKDIRSSTATLEERRKKGKTASFEPTRIMQGGAEKASLTQCAED